MTIDACETAVNGNLQLSIPELTKLVANAALRGARGNSGVILSQLLRGMQKALSACETIDCKGVSSATQKAAKSAYKAVMKPTEGTILTVAREMAECAAKHENDFEDVVDFVAVIAKAGKDALMKTPDMLPQLKQAGVVDSGGQGLLYLVEGALHVLKTGNVIARNAAKTFKDAPAAANVDVDNLKFQYCTECIIDKKDKNSDAFALKMKLEPKGDSMVVVDDEEIIKIHIHTNNPDYVLAEALKLGELYTVKIENMKVQHNAIVEGVDGKNVSDVAESEPTELKKYGFVCVAAGDGLVDTFNSLGVDCVIKGGQTMNPSTDDILSAVESINAENIYIFPNNKNIIMASEQAKELSDKNVFVIPTKSITQSMSCILAFDEDSEPEDNFATMTQVLDDVKSAQITYAVRDTVVDDFEIKPDDILGIVEGKIKCVDSSVDSSVFNVVEKMVDDESSVITLFYGEDISESNAEELKLLLEEKYDECDVYMHFGGQPVYYYLISVE